MHSHVSADAFSQFAIELASKRIYDAARARGETPTITPDLQQARDHDAVVTACTSHLINTIIPAFVTSLNAAGAHVDVTSETVCCPSTTSPHSRFFLTIPVSHALHSRGKAPQHLYPAMLCYAVPLLCVAMPRLTTPCIPSLHRYQHPSHRSPPLTHHHKHTCTQCAIGGARSACCQEYDGM